MLKISHQVFRMESLMPIHLEVFFLISNLLILIEKVNLGTMDRNLGERCLVDSPNGSSNGSGTPNRKRSLKKKMSTKF